MDNNNNNNSIRWEKNKTILIIEKVHLLLFFSSDEFSLLFDVEHSPKRKIRLHRVNLPKKKILDASFSETHSIIIFSGNNTKTITNNYIICDFSGSLVYTWGLEHFENVFTSNIKNYNSNKYPTCVNYLRNKNIIQ